VRFNDKLAVA